MSTNPSRFLYISESSFDRVLKNLNVKTEKNTSFDEDQRIELIDRAVGDLESDLVERFVVPLQGATGPFSSAPTYTRQKVLNAITTKIREIIGNDEQKNIVVESTEKFVDLKKISYRDHIKVLLNHKREFKLKLQTFAEDAVEPVQDVGIARADNVLDPNSEIEELIF